MCSRTHDTGESRAYLGNLDRGVDGGDGGNGITTEERSNEDVGRLTDDRLLAPRIARRVEDRAGRDKRRASGRSVLISPGAILHPLRRPQAGVPAGRRLSSTPFLRFSVVTRSLRILRSSKDERFLLSVFARSGHSSLGRTSFSRGRNAADRGRGRATRGRARDFTSDFGPQTHDSTRRKPHFIRLTQARSPTRP